MQTLLILGDCQSNGNNCLAHEIIKNDEPRTWSLRFHNDFGNVFKWYLKHRKENNVKTPVSVDNMQNVVWHYLWEQERRAAWPNLLTVPNVINISINGGHFIGHHNRLKKYLAENPKPDYVLITDYTFSHIAYSFKYNNQRYVFEKENYSDAEWNPDRYPIEVHKKRLKNLEFQKSQTKDWHILRHLRGYNMLTKFLNSYNISWSTLRFGNPNPENTKIFGEFMHQGIDCTDIGCQYMSTYGEDAKLKLSLQRNIADRVQEHLNNV